MKGRAFWSFLAVAALVLAAAYWLRNRTPPVLLPGSASTAAAAKAAAEKKPKPEVAIQEGKTIDFSPGVAVVKDDAKQKAAIDKALKEMESAVQDVTFPAPGQKKAEPPPAPPKP